MEGHIPAADLDDMGLFGEMGHLLFHVLLILEGMEKDELIAPVPGDNGLPAEDELQYHRRGSAAHGLRRRGRTRR